MTCEPAFYQRFFSDTDRKRPIVNSISNFQTTINLRLNSVLSKLEATALSKVEYAIHVLQTNISSMLTYCTVLYYRSVWTVERSFLSDFAFLVLNCHRNHRDRCQR